MSLASGCTQVSLNRPFSLTSASPPVTLPTGGFSSPAGVSQIWDAARRSGVACASIGAAARETVAVATSANATRRHLWVGDRGSRRSPDTRTAATPASSCPARRSVGHRLLVATFIFRCGQEHVDLAGIPALQGRGGGHLLGPGQPAPGCLLVPLLHVAQAQQETELILVLLLADGVFQVADGPIIVLGQERVTRKLEPIVGVALAVIDHPVPIQGGPPLITQSFVEAGQVAHGHKIAPIRLQGLQIGRLGIGGGALSQIEYAPVGPGRGEQGG